MKRAMVFLVLVLTLLRTQGQSLLTAGSPVPMRETDHWSLAVIEPESTAILHQVVPKERLAAMRLAHRMGVRASSVAMFEDTLYVAIIDRPVRQGQMPSPPPRATSVLSSRSVWSEGRWVNVPAGMMRTHASLPAGREIEGFTASEVGPIVLLGKGNRGEYTRRELMVLSGSRWFAIVLPEAMRELEAFSDLSRPCTTLLSGTRDGMVIAQPHAGGTDLYFARFSVRTQKPSDAEDPEASIFIDTVGVDVSWSMAFLAHSEQRPTHMVVVDRQLVLGSQSHSGVQLRVAALPEMAQVMVPVIENVLPRVLLTWRDLGEVSLTADQAALVALPGMQRVIVISPSVETKVTSIARATHISLATGQVMEDVTLQVASPASAADYRLVGIFLTYVVGMLAVLLVPYGKDPQIFVTPTGWVLASAPARLVAGTIDLCMGIAVSVVVMGRRAVEVLQTPVGDVLLTSQGQMLVLFSVLATVLLTTLTECTVGGSPGKLLVGLRVADLYPKLTRNTLDFTGPVQPEVQEESELRDGPSPVSTIGLRAALVRNVIKWCLPPLALVGMLTRLGRHRGDILGECAVMTPDPHDDDAGVE